MEEDLLGERLAGEDPIAALAAQNPDLLLNLSASPFGRGKQAVRRRLAARAAARLACPVVYVNQVGGNDDLVFDGASFVVNAAGSVVKQLACAAEQLAVWDAATDGSERPAPEPSESMPPLSPSRAERKPHLRT